MAQKAWNWQKASNGGKENRVIILRQLHNCRTSFFYETWSSLVPCTRSQLPFVSCHLTETSCLSNCAYDVMLIDNARAALCTRQRWNSQYHSGSETQFLSLNKALKLTIALGMLLSQLKCVNGLHSLALGVISCLFWRARSLVEARKNQPMTVSEAYFPRKH